MAVNRAARDLTAETLAAYMRGDIDNLALDDVLQDLPSDDATLNDIIINVWFCYDDFKSHPIRVSDEGWVTLQRILAFLKTDLEQRELPGRYRRYEAKDVLTLVTLFLWATAVWMLRSDGLTLAACWLLIGAIWCSPILREKERAASTESVEDTNYPFGSNAQWQSAKHHLAMFRLPAYKPPDESRPLRSPLVERIMHIPAYVLMAALAPLLMLLSLWPRRRKQRSVP